MLTKTESSTALLTFFKKNQVATLTELFTVLHTKSRMSVFRRLRDLNYLSSYTHTGRYYTIPTVIHFDDNDLWFGEGVGFSKAGNLKETIKQFVTQSAAGKTHDELETQLNVRVHNTLLDLVRANKIARKTVQSVYLYLSIDSQFAESQLAQRNHLPSQGKQNVLSDWLMIEALIEIIRCHQLPVDFEHIATTLCDRGVVITALQVEQVLDQVGVKKTLGYP
jgi:hypothetical protein